MFIREAAKKVQPPPLELIGPTTKKLFFGFPKEHVIICILLGIKCERGRDRLRDTQTRGQRNRQTEKQITRKEVKLKERKKKNFRVKRHN